MHHVSLLFNTSLIKTVNKKKNSFRLLKIQRRVYAVSTSLKYFMLNRWIFNNNKMLEITKTIHPSDLECFRIDDNVIDVEMYTKSSFLGGSKYVLKEEVEKCGSVRK